jgi:hypothetical protein
MIDHDGQIHIIVENSDCGRPQGKHNLRKYRTFSWQEAGFGSAHTTALGSRAPAAGSWSPCRSDLHQLAFVRQF